MTRKSTKPAAKSTAPIKSKVQTIVWQPNNATYVVSNMNVVQYRVFSFIMRHITEALMTGTSSSLINVAKLSSINSLASIIAANMEVSMFGNPVIRFNVKEEFSVDRRNIPEMKRNLENLYKTLFEFPFKIDGVPGVTIAGLVSKFTLKANGDCEIIVNNEILPFLVLYGGGYGNGITKYFYDVMQQLTSKYSMRLYGILCSMESREFPYKTFDVDELRRILGFPESEPDKKVFQTLKKIKDELGDKADVWPEYYFLKGDNPAGKRGRKPIKSVKIVTRSKRNGANGVPSEKTLGEYYVMTFNAMQLLAEFKYIGKDQALVFADAVSEIGKCYLISSKYQYYKSQNDASNEGRSRAARAIYSVLAEEMGEDLKKRGLMTGERIFPSRSLPGRTAADPGKEPGTKKTDNLKLEKI